MEKGMPQHRSHFRCQALWGRGVYAVTELKMKTLLGFFVQIPQKNACFFRPSSSLSATMLQLQEHFHLIYINRILTIIKQVTDRLASVRTIFNKVKAKGKTEWGEILVTFQCANASQSYITEEKRTCHTAQLCTIKTELRIFVPFFDKAFFSGGIHFEIFTKIRDFFQGLHVQNKSQINNNIQFLCCGKVT